MYKLGQYKAEWFSGRILNEWQRFSMAVENKGTMLLVLLKVFPFLMDKLAADVVC